MNKNIDNLKKTRTHLLSQISDLSAEQLNKIPDGFNNNIIWNLAHMVSAQQGLCYARAGVTIPIEDKYYTPFRPGTKPEGFIDAAEIAVIKELIISTLNQLQTDYNNGIFENYPAFTTRYGVELASIDQSLGFIPFHDGMHAGVIMALKKFCPPAP